MSHWGGGKDGGQGGFDILVREPMSHDKGNKAKGITGNPVSWSEPLEGEGESFTDEVKQTPM